MSSAADKPDTARGVFVQKQTSNIYTVLLILSFLAICLGCVFLSMEMGRYNWDMKAAEAKSSVHAQPVVEVMAGWTGSLLS